MQLPGPEEKLLRVSWEAVNLMDERAGPLHSENPKCNQNCFISSGTHRLFTPLTPFSGSEHPSIQHPRASSISVEFPFALGGQGRPSLSTQLLPWRAPTHSTQVLSSLLYQEMTASRHHAMCHLT